MVPAVEISGVTKTFRDHVAVSDLNLSVPPGCVYGFIGPNGAGKTTTLRMIMNIIRPDRGEIRVLGETLEGAATDRVGYLPEERGLYKKMQVRELLRFFGELKSGHDVRRQVEHWLERLDLLAWAGKKVETLSKGMSQKVQFIATVVSEPELVILDEPFSGLDPVNQEIVKNAILELRDRGTTVIFSTHDMNVAERMCDSIFMIHRGRKVLDGTLAVIQDKYGSDTIRVRAEGGAAHLRDLPGVTHVNDFGQMQELRMTEGCDPQEVLAAVLARTRVRGFDVVRPSLQDVFIRIAGPDAAEVEA